MRLFVLAIVFVLGLSATADAAWIEVDTKNKILIFYDDSGLVRTYPVAVPRKRLQWSGTHTVSRKSEWPSWTPTERMRKRDPNLPKHVPGGPDNPLGARALYLGNTMYRIHGNNNPDSIGQAVSSGCFRMHNSDIIELYDLVPVGTPVTVY